jgi:hypothetical protein
MSQFIMFIFYKNVIKCQNMLSYVTRMVLHGCFDLSFTAALCSSMLHTLHFQFLARKFILYSMCADFLCKKTISMCSLLAN